MYKINKPIRLIELFAGIGSQALALRNIGADFEQHKVIEIDKSAIKSYNAIHNTNFEPADITQLTGQDLEITNKDKYEYIITYSFPCQSISIAGKKEGFKKDSGTKSSLLWEVERLLKETPEKPQILLCENVKAITNKNNIDDLNQWIDTLNEMGYKSYYQVLRASDYGTPQMRDRFFMISIYNSDEGYIFPDKQPLAISADDLIDQTAEHRLVKMTDWEKERYIEQLKKLNLHQGYNCVSIRRDRTNNRYEVFRKEQSFTVTTGDYHRYCGKAQHIALCNTIISHQGNCGQTQHTVLCQTLFNKDYGYTGALTHQAICHTLGTSDHGYLGLSDRPGLVNVPAQIATIQDFNFYKLNANEALRLMGFDDVSIAKAQQVTPQSRLYAQAGNSICVSVLEAIFKQFLIPAAL